MSKFIKEKYFHNLFDYFTEPILTIDKNSFVIKYCNTEFENMIGKSFKYLEDKYLDKVISKNLFFLSNLKDISEKNRNFIIKDRIKFKEDEFEVKCIIFEEKDPYLSLFFLKVEKENKFSLIDQNIKFLNDILAILSHEVNNPITTIKIATDLLRKKQSNDDEELFEIIKKEADRIKSLFENFNIFNNDNLKKASENIHEIIRYSLIKFKENNFRTPIIEEFDPSLPNIKVHRESLLQVFDNIIKNSFEASTNKTNSFVKISTKFIEGERIKIPNIAKKVKKNYISVSITDNGTGVDPREINKLYLPFYTKKKKGSGIGLFLVKKIINDHEGDISIKSINGLTRVDINLPI
jgi:two-component system nitrogen regulation sensor histidine kinase GlnL